MSKSVLLESHNVKIDGDVNSTKTVVLAHGFGSDQSSWRFILPYLLVPKLGLKIVLLDLAFVSASTKNRPDMFDYDRYNSLEGFANDLVSILDELQIKTCFYVGHSMSGMIGCIASIRRPALFQKLILLAASPRYLNDGHDNYVGGFEEDVVSEMYASMDQNFTMWAKVFAPLVAGESHPSAAAEFCRTLLLIPPGIALHVAKAIFQSDYREILPAVTVACHIIHTQKDVAVPLPVCQYLRRRLGGSSTAEMLETDGHLPHISSPAILAPVLVRLLTDDQAL